MAPKTAQDLRQHVRGWPVADLRAAAAAGLPGLDVGMARLLADCLVSDGSTPPPPVNGVQVWAIWPAVQRLGQ